MKTATKYFLDQDAASSYWYLVEAEHRIEWNAWQAGGRVDIRRSDLVPPYAHRLAIHFSLVEFTAPESFTGVRLPTEKKDQ